jgi:glycosyltransferase involved in cell wall biosynthesis
LKDEKISLCCIAGNCEGIIGSFIEQFRPVADEICIVRAVGNVPKDKSLSIAVNAGCKVGRYFNSREGGKWDWPHVDSFAAARQQAWDMASHEWVMWADIDDTIDAASIKEFRRMVQDAPANLEMIQCPYVVPDQGIHRNVRERIVRRGKFIWQMPVHEFLVPIDGHPYNYVQTRKAKIVHGAKSDRRASCERNIRILEALTEEERDAGVYFYLFSEYHGTGRMKEAVEAATKFLNHKNAGENERYEVLLQLARLTDDPAQMAKLLHECHRTSPDRAECLYELTNLELTFGNVDRAQAYMLQMQALPLPERAMWNVRDQFYGWSRKQLETQVLRCSGQEAKANAIEYNVWKKAGGKISLLHATRGRTLQATRTRATWFERASDPEAIEHIFAFDADDEHSQPLRRFRHVMLSGNGGCVEAWNVAAHISSGDVIVQLSDDWIPPENWDKLILERLGDLSQSKVLAISDGNRKDGLLCMAICTRARFKEQGFLFHPDFTGVFSDTWFSRCAYKDGVVIDARDIEFKHCHPFFGTAESDETYARQNATERYTHGQRIYNQLEAAEGRTISTHCSVRLGDNLSHLQFLRKLARRYRRTIFRHTAHADYLLEMRDVVADIPNISLVSEIKDGSIEVWKGHEGFWYEHPDRNDFVKVYIAWFDELARKMGLENPIKQASDFLFDYPALLQKTPLDGPFDFLIINSPPMSGQLKAYTDLEKTCLDLKNKYGFTVISTAPVLGVECTQDYKLSVTAIGSLSRQCRNIIMVSTGPSWPTFNIYNQESVEMRIVMLDNERLNLSPNTVHVSNEAEIMPILREKGIIPNDL